VTTDSKHDKPVAPNLLERRFDGWTPNQAWVADITYVLTDEGWLYLAVVMDLATRKIVGWSMSERIHAALRRLEVGVLALQARSRTDHAHRSWQSVRQQVAPRADSHLRDDGLDERQGQLLG
jgi:transposase InsO family protein